MTPNESPCDPVSEAMLRIRRAKNQLQHAFEAGEPQRFHLRQSTVHVNRVLNLLPRDHPARGVLDKAIEHLISIYPAEVLQISNDSEWANKNLDDAYQILWRCSQSR